MNMDQVNRWLSFLTNVGVLVGIGDMRESFVADVRRIASEEGLPLPQADGSW